MRIVFFGTPDYVLPILKSLQKTFRVRAGESPIAAVVTQRPKPVGRKKILTYSAVDKWARIHKVKISYDFSELPSADVGVLAAYGAIIPKKVIDHFPHGILNVHPSLLPEFRGASPIQATIVTGQEAGATIIKIDEEVDHGPIVGQFKEEVKVQDTTEALRERLFKKSAEVLTTLLPAYLEGKTRPREQNHKKASFTTLLKKSHGFIPPKYLSATMQGASFKGRWKIPFVKDYTLTPTPYTLERFIRTMQPWPVAWTYVQLTEKQKNLKTKKRLKILKAYIENGKLDLDTVQLEGKNPVTWRQFYEAYPEMKLD